MDGIFHVLAGICIYAIGVFLWSYFIVGVYLSAQSGRVLTPISDWVFKIYQRGPEDTEPYWHKPFLGCYRCMASLWAGFPLYAILVWLFANPIPKSPNSILVILFCVMSLSAIFAALKSFSQYWVWLGVSMLLVLPVLLAGPKLILSIAGIAVVSAIHTSIVSALSTEIYLKIENITPKTCQT